MIRVAENCHSLSNKCTIEDENWKDENSVPMKITKELAQSDRDTP